MQKTCSKRRLIDERIRQSQDRHFTLAKLSHLKRIGFLPFLGGQKTELEEMEETEKKCQISTKNHCPATKKDIYIIEYILGL